VGATIKDVSLVCVYIEKQWKNVFHVSNEWDCKQLREQEEQSGDRGVLR